MANKDLLDGMVKVDSYQDKEDQELSQALLYQDLEQYHPEQVTRVFNAPECEIEPQFMGFVDTYRKLSKIIPLECTIIDFGCYAAAQAWYFRRHKLYIGIDIYPVQYRFKFNNTFHYEGLIQDWFIEQKNVVSYRVQQFAISNYVPQNHSNQSDKLIKETYQNCYIYYPGR